MKRIFFSLLFLTTFMHATTETKNNKAKPVAKDQVKPGAVQHESVEIITQKALGQKKLSALIAAYEKAIQENHPDKSTLQADLAILKKMQGANTISLISLGKQLSSSLQNLIKSLYGALGYSQAAQEARAFASA